MSITKLRLAHPALVLALALAASCAQPREKAERWQAWYDTGADIEVEEPILYTTDPYDAVPSGSIGIATLLQSALSHTSDNDGPVFAEALLPNGPGGCSFWKTSDQLPATVSGTLTSPMAVYKKIEGCEPAGFTSEEKFYGSYWLQDATGGVFVLNDSRTIHGLTGARVTLKVDAVRRRYGIDMIYVSDILALDPGPYPVRYDIAQRPLTAADQSLVKRASGVVVSETGDFGEVLLQPDGYTAGTCAADSTATRAHCLIAIIDSDLTKRGNVLHVGQHLELTGPVSQSAYFDDASGVITNFYAIYVSRLGQVASLTD